MWGNKSLSPSQWAIRRGDKNNFSVVVRFLPREVREGKKKKKKEAVFEVQISLQGVPPIGTVNL